MCCVSDRERKDCEISWYRLGKVIKSPQEGENYKFLGILQADSFLGER